jgi:peptidoglycan/LPS O-acetylase OafA/YrhL
MLRLARWTGPAAVALITAILLVGAPFPLMHNALLTPLFGLLIYSVALDRGPLGRFLAWRPIVALGEASYALYILHLTLFVIDRKVIAFLPGYSILEGEPFFPLFLATAIAASLATYRYIEMPARARIRAWSSKRGGTELAPIA